MAIGTNIDYTTRKLVDFVPDGQTTKSVTLNTGEVLDSLPVALEDEKEATITESGTVTISPTSGKEAMKKVKVTVSFKLKEYRFESEPGTYSKIYAFQDTPTKVFIGDYVTDEVTYESTTDTILFNGDTYTRYPDGDIILA